MPTDEPPRIAAWPWPRLQDRVAARAAVHPAFSGLADAIDDIVDAGLSAHLHGVLEDTSVVLGQTDPLGFERITLTPDGDEVHIAYSEQPNLEPVWQRRCTPEAVLGALRELLGVVRWVTPPLLRP
jgi:hypothetical protein